MTPAQAQKLEKLMRTIRAFEKDRVDLHLNLLEEVISMISDNGESESAIAISGDEVESDRLINKTELSKRLGISTRTIDEQLAEGLPFIKFGKRIQFDYADVPTWAKSRTIRGRRKSNLRVVR